MTQEDKENIAYIAACQWCRCFKCDGIINATGSKCDKEKLLTCHKWYDGYRTALLAFGLMMLGIVSMWMKILKVSTE